MTTLRGMARLVWTEIRDDWMWNAGWAALIFIYATMAVFLYPGEDALREILGFLQAEELFKAFLGDIGGKNPSYVLWVSLVFSIVTVLFFLYGIMTGPRIVLRPVDNGVGEILHVLPMRRVGLHGIRLLEAFIISMGLFVFIGLILLVPWTGASVPSDRAFLLVAWGIMFLWTSMILGMILGLVSGTTGKGIQLGLLVTILLYAFQSLSRVLPNQFGEISNWNVLEWLDINSILLENEMPQELALKIIVLLAFGILISGLLFEHRDLMKDPPIPILNKTGVASRILRRSRDFHIIFGPKKSGIFTFWGRVIERRFPFAADFIYSERLVMFIAFWAVMLIWPLQMAFYPQDEAGLVGTIAAFSETPYMRLFTYGHDLASDPYLWYLVTQAVGNHWIIFVPLVVYWVGKIVRNDTNALTGEIMASLAVSERRVVLERVMAACLEMLIILFQMVAWLVITEYGITGKTDRTPWEIIATIAVYPLYVFLLTGSVVVALVLKRKGFGVKISRIIILGLLLAFIIGKMVAALDHWYVTLLFGLYDPVLVIQEKSIFVNNYGILVYTILAVFSSILVREVAHLYQWMYVDET